MKTQTASFVFWWALYWIAGVILEWIMFADVLAGGGPPGLVRFWWFFPVVLGPTILISTCVVLAKEKRRDIRLLSLKWNVCTLSLVAALLASNFYLRGIGGLVLSLTLVALLLFACFWSTKKSKEIREGGNSNHPA